LVGNFFAVESAFLFMLSVVVDIVARLPRSA
jgi:hypothetical protein